MKITKFCSLLATVLMIVSLFSGCASQSPTASPPPSPPASPVNTENPPAEPADTYEEGTSEADNIVNTTAADKVILVVSFGTSYNQSRSLTIGGIEAAIQNAYPDYQVRRAFTSQIIIDKLAERESLKIDNVTGAMDRLVLDGAKEVIIQPTTVRH